MLTIEVCHVCTNWPLSFNLFLVGISGDASDLDTMIALKVITTINCRSVLFDKDGPAA